MSKHSLEISREKVTGGCFSRRLKRSEYKLKTEQLIKANSKVHPKLLCQLLNTTYQITRINSTVLRNSSYNQSS